MRPFRHYEKQYKNPSESEGNLEMQYQALFCLVIDLFIQAWNETQIQDRERKLQQPATTLLLLCVNDKILSIAR